MHIITYQGQSILAEQLAETNTAYGEGSDALYRDESGIYYLERDRTCIENEPEDHSAQEIRRVRQDFTAVHRININAAILWSIDNCNRFNVLREEAAEMLMDARILAYDDPLPNSYFEIKRARGKQGAARWVKKVLAGTTLPTKRAKRLSLEEAEAAAAQETVTLNLTSKEDGSVEAVEILRATFDEIERRATGQGQDFATYFVEMVRKVVDAGETQEASHTLTLEFSSNQWGMLSQAAKYEAMNPREWIMDALRGVVVSCLTDCYGHREALANVAWNGSGQKPPRRGRVPSAVVSEAELPITEDARAILEKRAQTEGTDLHTQYRLMTHHGTNAVFGFPKVVTAKLDPFHGDLLRAFERRHGIAAEDYARSIVEWHLKEMYDIGWNGGQTEPDVADTIRRYGSYSGSPTKEGIEKFCRAAGLNPAAYPEAVDDEDEPDDWDEAEAEADDDNFMAGRGRQPGSPADIALLAAAEPEPIDASPASPTSGADPTSASSKGKRKRVRGGKEGK